MTIAQAGRAASRNGVQSTSRSRVLNATLDAVLIVIDNTADDAVDTATWNTRRADMRTPLDDAIRIMIGKVVS